MMAGLREFFESPSNQSRDSLLEPIRSPFVRKTAELKFRTPDGASVGMKLNGIEYKGHKAGGGVVGALEMSRLFLRTLPGVCARWMPRNLMVLQSLEPYS